MTLDEMIELFEYTPDDHAYRTERNDLAAFIRLDKLVPCASYGRLISGAEHDQIWFSTDCEKLAAASTEEDIVFLRRNGVFYDNECESLSMFR